MNQLNIFWETWLDVVGYEGLYQVNGRGDVKSLNYKRTSKEKILKPGKDKDGYLYVGLRKDGKRKDFKVHRLVYEAFYEKIKECMEIDHIDTIRDNNSVENLRCVSSKKNSNNPITKKRQEDAMKKLAQDPEWKKKHAELAKMKSIPVNQYTLDGEFIKTWPSAREIERELGINHSNISLCCKGINKSAGGSKWKHAS